MNHYYFNIFSKSGNVVIQNIPLLERHLSVIACDQINPRVAKNREDVKSAPGWISGSKERTGLVAATAKCV